MLLSEIISHLREREISDVGRMSMTRVMTPCTAGNITRCENGSSCSAIARRCAESARTRSSISFLLRRYHSPNRTSEPNTARTASESAHR